MKHGNHTASPESADFPAGAEDIEEELWTAHDFVGAKYCRVDKLRKKAHLSDEEREVLRKHDEMEERIASEPKEVLREALKKFDDAEELLLRVIRSGSCAR